MKVVEVLKENGAASVGIRFEELSAEVLESFRGQANEAEDTGSGGAGQQLDSYDRKADFSVGGIFANKKLVWQ